MKNKIIINQSVKKYYQVDDDTFCDKFSILFQISAKIITENLFLIYLKLKKKLTISSKLRYVLSAPPPPPPPLGMCCWPLRAHTPLQSILWPIKDPILVISDATPSSGSSPLASYKKVLSRAFPPFITGST